MMTHLTWRPTTEYVGLSSVGLLSTNCNVLNKSLYLNTKGTHLSSQFNYYKTDCLLFLVKILKH